MVRVRTRQKNNYASAIAAVTFLAHGTMLIFYREVDRRDLGKTNEKNVVYVGFFIVFLGDFWASTNQILRFN